MISGVDVVSKLLSGEDDFVSLLLLTADLL